MTAETVHASCVARGGNGVLLAGASGRGKSDLALRLIDRGALLVSDDYTNVRNEGGRLIARAPDRIAGQMEIRGIGIVPFPHVSDVPVCLFVDLDGEPERMPDAGERQVAGVALPTLTLDPREPSAAIKVEIALARFGLEG
jgi:serine kinase of HPr protein (carbohydrate metabolism regulator)